MSVFNKRLREVRKERGMSINELAKHSGVGRTTLYTYEYTDHWPSSSVLLELANALDISTDYLLGRTSCLSNGIGNRPLDVD